MRITSGSPIYFILNFSCSWSFSAWCFEQFLLILHHIRNSFFRKLWPPNYRIPSYWRWNFGCSKDVDLIFALLSLLHHIRSALAASKLSNLHNFIKNQQRDSHQQRLMDLWFRCFFFSWVFCEQNLQAIFQLPFPETLAQVLCVCDANSSRLW